LIELSGNPEISVKEKIPFSWDWGWGVPRVGVLRIPRILWGVKYCIMRKKFRLNCLKINRFKGCI